MDELGDFNTEYTPNQDPLGGSQRFIAPFWADVDTTHGGKVEYTQSVSPTLLAKANAQINNAFPTAPEFSATNMFFVTWEEVRYYRDGSTIDKVMKFNWYGRFYMHVDGS